VATNIRKFTRQATPLEAGEPALEEIDITPRPTGGDVHSIPVDLISPSPYQPRTRFSEAGIGALADSISTLGLINPIAVRSRNGGYELITGERRLRAVKLLEHETIKATVHDVDDMTAAIMAFDENFRRQNLSEYENYRWVTIMIGEFSLKQVDIAEKLKVTAGRLSQIMSVGKLPSDVIERIAHMRFVTENHIRALRRLHRLDDRLMYELLDEMEGHQLNGVQVAERFDQLVVQSRIVLTPVDNALADINKRITYIRRNPGVFSPAQLKQIRVQLLKMGELVNQFLQTGIGRDTH